MQKNKWNETKSNWNLQKIEFVTKKQLSLDHWGRWIRDVPFWPSPHPCASFLLLSVCSSAPASTHCTNKKTKSIQLRLRCSYCELNLHWEKVFEHWLLAHGFAGAGAGASVSRWYLRRNFHWWRKTEREGLNESVRTSRDFEKLCLSTLYTQRQCFGSNLTHSHSYDLCMWVLSTVCYLLVLIFNSLFLCLVIMVLNFIEAVRLFFQVYKILFSYLCFCLYIK